MCANSCVVEGLREKAYVSTIPRKRFRLQEKVPSAPTQGHRKDSKFQGPKSIKGNTKKIANEK